MTWGLALVLALPRVYVHTRTLECVHTAFLDLLQYLGTKFKFSIDLLTAACMYATENLEGFEILLMSTETKYRYQQEFTC